MTSRQLVIEIELSGRARELREYDRPVESLVADLLRELQGEGDATMTVRPKERHEHLTIAVNGSRAFLGLDAGDGLFQFEGSPHAKGVTEMVIGGQATNVDSRQIVDLEGARTCIEEWLSHDEQERDPRWKRQ
jgi:hypothetical protein